jgi:hypothetical protein
MWGFDARFHVTSKSVDSEVANDSATAIIYSLFGTAGAHMAEMLGPPSLFALLQLFSRTREYPAILHDPDLSFLDGRGGYSV